jgi:predicted Zn-dependent protease
MNADGDPVAVLAHIGLARSYALSGDVSNARNQYREFLALWKDADPDLPVLREAKAELARLQRMRVDAIIAGRDSRNAGARPTHNP